MTKGSWTLACAVAVVCAAPLACKSGDAMPDAAGAAGAGATAGSGGASGAAGTGGAAGSSSTNDGGAAGASTPLGSAGAPPVGSTDAAMEAHVDRPAEASPDRAVDAPSTDGGAPSCGGELLCFDFESDPVGGKPGVGWTGQGTIDGTKSAHGARSLHVPAGNDSAFATLKPAGFFPPAGNEYYGRVLFWVDALPTSHWTFVRSKGPVAGKTYSAEYTYGGTGKHFIANYDTQGVASDCWKDAGNVPLGKWTCMEWHFKGATNELELWVDGVADAKAHVVGKGDGCIANGTAGTWFAPTFNALELGFAVYGGSTAFGVWYDDLALGKTRVGCL